MNDIDSPPSLHVPRDAGQAVDSYERSRGAAPGDAELPQPREPRATQPDGSPSEPTRDAPTIGDGRAGAQDKKAAPGGESHAARVHLVIGPVGAGKSTFAQRLVHERGAVLFTLDEWMVTLFRPDRPAQGVLAWYRERAQRCIDQIWKTAQPLAARGDEVVLEIGLLQRDERERFYERVGAAGLRLTLHVLDAARSVRRARVVERNRCQGATFSMLVPPEIFELASDLWQAPDPDECLGRDVFFMRTDVV